MSSINSFAVHVLKRDQKSHYSWKTQLLHHEVETGFRLTAAPGPRELIHHTKGKTFSFETHAIEFFWEKLPFSVGYSHHPVTKELSLYCNIHEPLKANEKELGFVDLDLDVVKNKNFQRPTIIDQDEFLLHAVKYDYPKAYLAQIPNIAEALVLQLNEGAIFQEAFIKEVFATVFQNPKALTQLSKTQLNQISTFFLKQPWRVELSLQP